MGRGRRFGTHHHGGRGARCRWLTQPGTWEVHARVERFVEPALLLVLRGGETHGYDLAESLAELAPDDPVDLGNLYRLLRSLEAEGVVTSRWRDDLPGRVKRTYELTDDGRLLLDTWAEALRKTDENIAAFLRRYEEGAAK
jgi:DNA-binding PadR family transcriptional regulator